MSYLDDAAKRGLPFDSLAQHEKEAINNGVRFLADAASWDWWGALADHNGFRYHRTKSAMNGYQLWHGTHNIGYFR